MWRGIARWAYGAGLGEDVTSVGAPEPVRILLVDDDPDDRALAERALRQEIDGLEAEHIGTAAELARALERGDFDLVVTDHHLGWTSGLSVLLAVKERDPDLPVVMYTGTGSEEIAVEVMRAGLDDYILKSPEHRVRLAASVRAALARAAERRNLREAEARYQSLFRDSQAPMLVTDPVTGLVVDANPAACAFYGYSREELAGKHASELSASSPEEFSANVQRVLERGERHLQASHRLASGEIRDVEIYVGAMKAQGKDLQYGIIHDITDRKLAEEALRRERDFTTALVHHSPAFFVAVGLDGNVVMANRAILQELGYDVEEVVGQEFLRRFVPEEAWDEVRRVFGPVAHSGLHIRGEIPVMARNGRRLLVDWHGQPVLGPKGEVDYLFGVGLDITTQREAERAIRSLALFPNENPNPVLRLAADGTVTYANGASAEVLACWGCRVGTMAPDPWPEIVRQVLAGEEKATIDVSCRGRIFSLTVTPVFDGGYVNPYGMDVTERVRAEGELRRRDDVLEAVAFAVEGLLKAGSWQEVIPVVLERLGRAVAVSRSYLFECHLDRQGAPAASQRFEWVAPGVSRQIDNPDMQEIPQLHGPFARWFRSFRKGEALFGKIRLFPQEEQEALREQDIRSIAVVPIMHEGSLWGLVGFDDCRAERDWAAGEIDALRLAAGTLGAAIQRRRSEDLMSRRAREMSALYQTSLEITSRVHLPELLEIIVRRAADLLGAPMGALYLVEPDRKSLRLAVPHNLPPEYLGARLRFGEGLSGRVAETSETLMVEDYSQWNGKAAVYRDAPFRRVLAVPLKRGGQVIGVINVTDTERVGSYDPEDVRLITLLADQAAIAIENSRLLAETERRAGEMDALYHTSLDITSRVGLPELLETIVRRAASLIGASMGGMYLTEPDGKSLRCVVSHNLPSEYIGNRLALGEGLAGRVAQSGEPIVVEDYQIWEGRAAIYAASPFRRVLGVPLKRRGQVIGVIDVVDSDRTGPYDPEEVRLITLLAEQAAIAVENDRLLEVTERRAEEMDALYQTSLEFTSQASLKELMVFIVDRACRLLRASNGTLYVMRPDGETLEAAVQFNLPEKYGKVTRRLGEGLSGRAAQSGEITIAADYTGEGWGDGLYEEIEIGRALAVPLKRMGRVIGVLSVADTGRKGDYEREEIRLANLFADQAAIAVETARLLEETQRRSAYLEAITSTSRALRTAQTQKDMLPIILDQLLELTGAGGSVIALLDEESQLVTELGRGLWSEETGQRQRADEGVMGYVIKTHTSLFLADARQDPRPLRPEMLAGQNAVALVPLLVGDRVIGVVGIGRDTPFSEDEIRILTAIAEMAANAINRAGVTETLEQRVRERTSELEVSNERLKELDRLKSEFVSNVSHELRTPISNILLYLDLLGQPGRSDRQPAYLGILKGEAERLGSLIEDLLTLSRIERGVFPLELEPHSLDPLIAEVVSAHLPRAAVKQVRFTHEPNPKLPVIWVSRAEIQRVFTNLLGNAVAYSPPGGIVDVRAEQQERRGRPFVTIEVHNGGPPIHPEDMAHLFERFHRGRNAQLHGEPGTGLGLAISKEIVERHQGWIEVESLEERGTTFTIWIPVRPQAA